MNQLASSLRCLPRAGPAHGLPFPFLHQHFASSLAVTSMDSVIDLSDASKALDLARIRAQLM